MQLRHAVLVLVGALLPALAYADVKPHALCTEGMVLQQKAKATIWGTAAPGEEVTVEFRDKQATAKADEHGKWAVRIETGAAGGPLPMTIRGKNTINYKNVLVGEVWVASGQSNMEMAVGGCNDSDKNAAKGSAPNSNLRVFTVQKNPQAFPVDDVNGKWIEASPNTVFGFTAVGYFFGRDLQKAIKQPVGVIHTSWGGTRAEAWTSPRILANSADYKAELEAFRKAWDNYKKDMKNVKNPMHANSPSVLYNGMIHPLLKYTIAGAIWYQGESNAGKAYHYRTLFPMMIQNWRDDWKVGNFPFYFVQLAPWTQVVPQPGESNWAELREAQLMTLKLPSTGMAVITDYGNVQDIHPTPKQPVGERLSLIARANVYGEKIEYSGPIFKEMKVDGNKAILSFDHRGSGLVSKNLVATEVKLGNRKQTAYRVQGDATDAPLMGFTVCGEDKKFHVAKATIEGDTVVVTCPDVARPIAVRFGWAQHPVCNLFNKEGLPASPFRTDNFPVSTEPKKK